jgi:lysozyme
MTPRHRVSRTAISLIKRFEGYRQKAAQLPDQRWTIGYGHSLTARQGAEVAENDAEALLIYDLIAVAHAVNEQVFAPLNQNQFDALCSFAFNIGLDNFRTSGVLKRLNEGAPVQAACAMELWRKAEFQGERIVIDALVRRRAAEKLLFLTPPGDAWVPAPSPILKPVLDADAHDVVPHQAPAEISASMDGETVQVTRADLPPVTPAPPEADEAGPAKAAAEAVTARLQTIFPDAGEEPAQAREIEPPVHPENIPEDPHPQADFGPPAQIAEEEPFTLVAPSDGEEDEIVPRTMEDEEEASDELSGPDLFDEPTPANDLVAADDELPVENGEPRTMIDDAAPFDFGAVVPRPLPEQPKGGVLSWVALAIVGLAFFAGGVFWATNARPAAQAQPVSPLVVGWLAGVAGVIFFAVAVFLLLQRLGQASERAARTRHR